MKYPSMGYFIAMGTSQAVLVKFHSYVQNHHQEQNTCIVKNYIHCVHTLICSLHPQSVSDDKFFKELNQAILIKYLDLDEIAMSF